MNAMPKSSQRSAKQTFSAYPLHSGLYRIDFFGNLPLRWAGSLAQGLNDKQINILSGSAKRITASQWIGEFVVDPLHAITEISEMDLGALIHAGDYKINSVPAITRFVIKECFKSNGSIYVEVEGADQLGFLSGLLKKFRACGLFPWDFSISTDNDRIHDKFHLMGPGGLAVSGRILRILELKLNELVR